MNDRIAADVDAGVIDPAVAVVIETYDIAYGYLISRHLRAELRLGVRAMRQVYAVVVKEAVLDETRAVETAGRASRIYIRNSDVTLAV